ncbi:hypothetical protein [Streptomyces broussonetiae]|uniref:hypothetical protein n=1 Tax=Streptomyces broussonetiae TaxID=2686304 RepID=UPI001E42EA64|nr:hypothetical protein [Streptomyces broussonetiae]
MLHPSDRGRELLALADARMRREVDARTDGWSPDEVRALRTLLTRYNAAPSLAAEDT